jgi:Ni2+-binding GTPase involved in maturation of urease and hydrogenase
LWRYICIIAHIHIFDAPMTAPKPKGRAAVGPGTARFIMIGGFLGAGKTTAVGRLAARLTEQGLRVGIITNDQGRNLVDTAMLRSQHFATEEIPGGCFCCRFDSLVEAAQRLTEGSRPQVFIAEPVGSCTDLVATVAYPLRRLYGENFTVAPVSVLVDPIRALRVFGVEEGGSFSEKVLYIYKKQLEEADLVIISKCDLLDEARMGSLRAAIAARFPGKEVLAVSPRKGTGLEPWFAQIASEAQASGEAMAVDYKVYADGEALLGWLNCTAQLAAAEAFDGNSFLRELAGQVQQRLRASKAEVAHLKMTLSPDSGQWDIGVVSLVRNDLLPELAMALTQPVRGGRLIINLRAEAAPDVLGTVVQEALAAAAGKFATLRAMMEGLEQFRPGKPMPTRRFEKVAA